MYPIKYYDIVKDYGNPFNLRLKMVQFALERGIKKAALEFGTTRKTVRKWVKRYKEKGTRGLRNQSRAPHHIPHKTKKEIEELVLSLRETFPTFGPVRLKEQFSLPCSPWAIHRILKQNGKIKKRRRKHQERRDLRKLKARYQPFEKIQVDTKELRDIPQYWKYLAYQGFPRFEYTARDVKTGACFIAFSYTNDSTNASIFASLVLNQLKKYGVKLGKVIIQTDNGSEYINSSKLSKRLPVFTNLVENFFGVRQHKRIPPGEKTWQSDVETFHKRIEYEFFRIEDFQSITEFLGKAYAYQLWFNYYRKNSWKNYQTPVEILKKDYPWINPNVLNLPPVILETYLRSYQEPTTYLEEEQLKKKYVKLGLPVDSGYLLPYLSNKYSPVWLITRAWSSA